MKVLFIAILLTTSICSAQNARHALSKDHTTVLPGKIIIEVNAPSDYFKNKLLPNSSSIQSIELRTTPFDYLSVHPEFTRSTADIVNGKAKWIISAKRPLIVSSNILGTSFIFRPGDSIHISYQDNTPTVSGINTDEFKFQAELLKIQGLKGPTKHPLLLKSLDEYFAWITHLNNKSELLISILDSYKNKIDPFIHQYAKQRHIEWIECDKTSAFNGLSKLKDNSSAVLTLTDLNNIWDSTQKTSPSGQWLRSQTIYYPNGYYLYDYNRLDVRRKFNFDFTKDTLNQKRLRVELYYNHAKTKYKGHVLERLLQYIIAEEVINDLGTTDTFTQKMLKDYYSNSNVPDYKTWMREFIKKKMELRIGKSAPFFVLTDRSGKSFTKNDLKGKVALLDFWFTGCIGCKQMTPALLQVENKFKKDSNVVFISVSIDKDKNIWNKSIDEQKYTTGSAIHLFTGGEGDNHAMIRRFDISGYPSLVLLDANGRIAINPVPDPRNNRGINDLIAIILKESNKLEETKYIAANDGPYILHNNKQISQYTFEQNVLRHNLTQYKENRTFTVRTDLPNKAFEVKLKPNLEIEKCEYPKPSKLLALSDIEGNFGPFRQLLQKNGVIDDNFNWTFGTGHLVIGGDVFDRGDQVTECLWLIYNLEEKAKGSGGYVHFILGNHEIMNFKGDHRYVVPKYINNANKIGKSIAELYNTNSELGRWLMTKNIMEKIGNLLFVHGGIAPEINRIPISIGEINKLVRPYYTSAYLDSTDKYLLALYNDQRNGNKDRTAPFWFRGYYGDGDNLEQIPTSNQVDSTLRKFAVDRIVTGHTIVGDTIAIFYSGRVINTDTPHANGNTEALFIENNQYFRVNKEGLKVPLPLFDSSQKYKLAGCQ